MKKTIAGLQIEETLYRFFEEELLKPHPTVKSETFWPAFADYLDTLGKKNQVLLNKRQYLQNKIDDWNKKNNAHQEDIAAYKEFLKEIGYLNPAPAPFTIKTKNVDSELTEQTGPQLVVPVANARYALNAANARWGSLYDALYGTNVIDTSGDLSPGKSYNEKRGAAVIHKARQLLNTVLPLKNGQHEDAIGYRIENDDLIVELKSGQKTALQESATFVGFTGRKDKPESLLARHHGLHVELLIDPESPIGKNDPAHIKDIILEAAISTIMDMEDSTAAVDGEDKAHVYHNWLGLLLGTLREEVEKNGRTFTRKLNNDRYYTGVKGDPITLKGRSLMFVRSVGHLMRTPAIIGLDGKEVFEGLVDDMVSALAASLAFTSPLINSNKKSMYIVKPKMHGPEEVAFAREVFEAAEKIAHLPENTLKIGVMDEERRTSLNLEACIKEVQERLVFINTGFLDRTGDEIHTSMYYGPMVRKEKMKNQDWLQAYELNNVQIGLKCGLVGKAQIGKGMWAKPDAMQEMLKEKIAHPEAGATTAWVPSPTAATLHALHYHKVDVRAVQENLSKQHFKDYTDSLLTLPVVSNPIWSNAEKKEELENNCQGILGYVVRWVEEGVGCSKVPDIHNIPLMEDRATCRISSQHVANWLLHHIVSKEEVEETLRKMAQVVDQQNAGDPLYVSMAQNFDRSCGFRAAHDLIFKGVEQPSGYTEPILHQWRAKEKQQG